MPRYTAVVIGGGTTGTAVLRDLTMRGVSRVVLLEKKDLGSGTTGGCHSALHAGMRYIVNDPKAAEECAHENRILRRIAPHTVDPTNGLFIAINDEEVEYGEKAFGRARQLGLDVEWLEPKEILKEEPLITPKVLKAMKTPDTGFDPYRLALSQALDAIRNGAQIKTYHEVVEIFREGETVYGVRTRSLLDGSLEDFYAEVVINCAGPWAGRIAKIAGIDIPSKPNKGTMTVYSLRLVKPLVSRLRLPSDGDGLVSMGYQHTTLLGTTSVDINDPDQAVATPEEAEYMENIFSAYVPALLKARRLRVFCGVRPLVAPGPQTGRQITRSLILIDHENVHGVSGLITITGGKYATSRLMAEEAVNVAARQLGVKAPCRTHLEPLPGAEEYINVFQLASKYGLPLYAANKLAARYGTIAQTMLEKYGEHAYTICDCNQSVAAEVYHAVNEEFAVNLDDVRRRTRIGMGTCQGTRCSYKAAVLLGRARGLKAAEMHRLLVEYLNERWKGVRLVLPLGDMADQAELLQAYYGAAG
ncbi:TPA: anaerobic glycerol-3-phosphate dehydrogenase subunit A, partial [Candidatus Bathyarchaeota archaeon]|nr:anaerobic glycerol-3-phosphate dehydrogenase subunit A [Candidatus Bathyarchaeota archaeon]